MHLFVLIFIFTLMLPSYAFAQDRNVDRYTPPPMFGGAEPEAPPTSPEIRAPNNLDLINLDSISGRSHERAPSTEENKAPLPAPAQALKPPLPPRRPATFQVSQDYLDRITAPPPTMPAKPRRSPPVITPSALARDTLNANLLSMDVIDIYEKLSGKTTPEKDFINISPLRVDRGGSNSLQLTFSDNSATLTEVHAIALDEEFLHPLKTGGARIAIEAPTPSDTDKQQHRLALSRAIAIRNYLELNGIDRDHITINQIRSNTALSGNNTISLKLLE